ncbi:tetratricopeptide repeat protein [Aliikangiella sp. IMCC44359]|uniref:tetratricopeptide repeat protein n=1 Tax=Aliikangiella sp. IMCC44359 TaxID=3459125 RepID=UPI00403B1321
MLSPILANAKQAGIKELDERFKALSFNTYKSIAKNSKLTQFNDDNIEELAHKIKQLIKQNDHFSAIALIHKNINIIKDNISNQYVFEFIELLLKHNEYKIARSLYTQLKNESEQYFIANAALKFAKYHSDRHEWQLTLDYLNTELRELSSENTNHAFMLQGMALQYLKKHRQAIKIYEKIKGRSAYYSSAQLNIAVAHIRQDWWTDAHIVINQLFKDFPSIKQQELGNRLYLMLGYSLLSKEYYRESRESFRNISLDSQYTNKALMGISLAAISQGDNIGALNALERLKEKASYDLVVEESHLLLPHIYKKLEQYMTANAGYTSAVTYYQKRIQQINQELNHANYYRLNHMTINQQSEFIIAETPLKFTELYPQYFLNNLNELIYLKSKITSPSISQQIDKLYQEYSEAFNIMIKGLLEHRLSALNSYLNQAHYGIAQLYDKNSE